jgi:hypothetical protein
MAENDDVTNPAPTTSLPTSVRSAVTLMWIGAGVWFVSGLVYLPDLLDGIETMMVLRNEDDPGVRSRSRGTGIGAIVGLLVVTTGIGLWALMAIKNRSGQRWARVLATALFAIAAPFALWFTALSVTDELDLESLLPSVATFGVGLAAIILLWKQENTTHYVK